jgi:hypothetical protein
MITPRFLLASSASSFALVLLVACSSNTSGTSSSGSSSGGASGSTTPVSSADCSSRCDTKLKQCPDLAAQAPQGCSQLCGAQLTEGQMSCLEGKTCEQLAQADSFNALCPAGSTSSSGGTTSSSGSTGTFKKAGEACVCEGSQSGWQQCSGTSGPCEAGLVCYGIDKDTVCGTSCKNGEACAAGFECTEHLYQGVSVGKFCDKQ